MAYAPSEEYLACHDNLSLETEIGQLQEEAAELIVACSKLRRRVLREGLATRLTKDEALDNLTEEMADTFATIMAVIRGMDRDGILPEKETETKIENWLKRKEERFVENRRKERAEKNGDPSRKPILSVGPEQIKHFITISHDL